MYGKILRYEKVTIYFKSEICKVYTENMTLQNESHKPPGQLISEGDKFSITWTPYGLVLAKHFSFHIHKFHYIGVVTNIFVQEDGFCGLSRQEYKTAFATCSRGSCRMQE